MSKLLKCRLNISTKKGDGHISQIVTGFMMLKKQGIIDLEINCSSDYPFVSIVEVIMNNEINILYDMADGYIFDVGKVKEYAQKADYYFKRSFNREYNNNYDFASRIHPLGLNYHVTIKDNILDKPIGDNFLNRLKWRYKESQSKNYHQNFYVNKFENEPKLNNSDPLILFTTRTWSNEGGNINPDEAIYIDDMRAACIRRLKKEFGKNFIGGFTLRDFAKNNYSDCLLDESVTNRVNFMSLVKKADICISTMGLFESNGWKLAEYVAASKAIVSERLRYEVTGNFMPNRNYLEFSNVDECVKQTVKLTNDKDLMYEMKVNNNEYYNNYLRPDKLILNSLNVINGQEGLIQKIG